MLERLRQIMDTTSTNIKFTFLKIKEYIPIVFFSSLFILFMLFFFNASPEWVNNFFSQNGNNFNNIEKLFFSPNVIYFINIIFLLKFEILSLIYDSISLFIGFKNSLALDHTIFKIINFLKLNGEEFTFIYYNNLISSNLVNLNIFKYHY